MKKHFKPNTAKYFYIGILLLATLFMVTLISTAYLEQTPTVKSLTQNQDLQEKNEHMIKDIKELYKKIENSEEELSEIKDYELAFNEKDIEAEANETEIIENLDINKTEEKIVEKNVTTIIKPKEEKVDKKVEKIEKAEKIEEKREPIKIKEPRVTIDGKPKLAIIIDDISYDRQVEMFQSLNMPINLSVLPSTRISPNREKLVNNRHFMLHLPLEARTFKAQEEGVLKIGDSLETIENRIKTLRKEFPTVKYINNHTGSKFSENRDGMRKLLKTLKKYNFHFVDSLTTPKSVASEISTELNIKIFKRDVFLDNENDVSYITNQLKLAVKKAKEKGFAIAIGHPNKNTFIAINSSKAMLKDVELIYIETLYEKSSF